MEGKSELKELEEIPAIPREDLYEMIDRAGRPEAWMSPELLRRDQRLIASFFLLANRCSEGLGIPPENVWIEVSIGVLDEELQMLAGKIGRLRTEIDVGRSVGKKYENKLDLGSLYEEYTAMNALRNLWDSNRLEAPDKISARYPQTLVYVVRIPTLKRKVKISRIVPIPSVDPLAPFFIEEIGKEAMFEMTRQRVWQIFDRAGIYDFYRDRGYPIPKNPLRHSRLSEVSNVLNDAQLNRFAGWKIRGTADRYIHLRWEDFVGPLVKVARSAPPIKKP